VFGEHSLPYKGSRIMTVYGLLLLKDVLIVTVHGFRGSGFSPASGRRNGQVDPKKRLPVAESHTRVNGKPVCHPRPQYCRRASGRFETLIHGV